MGSVSTHTGAEGSRVRGGGTDGDDFQYNGGPKSTASAELKINVGVKQLTFHLKGDKVSYSQHRRCLFFYWVYFLHLVSWEGHPHVHERTMVVR